MTLQWFFESIYKAFLPSYAKTLLGILPYLAAGVLVSELLKFTSWTKIIYKWVIKSPFIAIASSSVIGIISPLCTYGTIPVVMELYKSGVNIAPLISFLAASSLMNPQLFIMTAGGISGIGLEIALVLVLAVLIISITLGMIMYAVPCKYAVKKSIALYEEGAFSIINRELKHFYLKDYLINCARNLRRIGVYLLIGVFLATVLELYIPGYFINNALGDTKRVQSVLLASLLGVPLYACGGGAIPFVDRLLQNGMGKGAGLAFFIVGSATRPAPLAALAVMFTPVFIILYCLFLVILSFLTGILYF